ncbi:hypothetical protein CsSME_00047444 [Camellia sinensis var. sinensis]
MDQLEQELVSLPVSSPDEVPSSMKDGFSALPPEVSDVGNLGSEIPGLDSAVHSNEVPSSMGILLIMESMYIILYCCLSSSPLRSKEVS